MGSNDLTITMRAKNLLKKGLSSAGKSISTFRSKLGGIGKGITKAFNKSKLAVAGLVAGIIAAIKHAEAFRAQMAQVSVMLGKNIQMLAGMKEAIIAMSVEFGESKETLSKGLFDILSSGIEASKAMDVLRVAMKAAVGGGTDVATSVDAITTILNAYSMEAEEATRVSDVLFQVVKDGKITYAELAENIGKLAPTARAAGLSLESMGATLAALVKVEKPERAMTALSSAMTVAAQKGMTLFQLVEKFRGKGLEDIVGAGISKRAAKGIAILAQNFGVLQQELKNFQDVTGNSEEAFKRVEDTRTFQKAWQGFLAILTKVGDSLRTNMTPELNKLVETLKRLNQDGSVEKWAKTAGSLLRGTLTVVKGLAKGVKAIADGFEIMATFAGGASSASGGLFARLEAGEKAVTDLMEAEIKLNHEREVAKLNAESKGGGELSKSEQRQAVLKRRREEIAALLAREKNRADREKIKNQERFNKLKAKESEIVAKIAAEEKHGKAVANQQGRVDQAQKAIDDAQRDIDRGQARVDAGIVGFLNEKKDAEQKRKFLEDEGDKIKKIRDKEARGIRVKKADKAFLDAVDMRAQVAREVELDKEVNGKAEDRLKEEQKALELLQKSNNTQLKKIRENLDELLVIK